MLTAMVRRGIIVTEYATRRTVASTLIHNERRLIIMATYVSLSDIISIISMLTQIITLCYVVFKNNRHKQHRQKITAQLPIARLFLLTD